MAIRDLLAPALVVLASLAGCIADVTDPLDLEEAAAPEGATTGPAALPDNRSGTFNAFEETNATETGVGGLDHAHDYWAGRDRVELLAGHFEMDSVVPPGEPAFGRLTVPPGSLVYEGAATVEVLFKDPARHGCFPGLVNDDYDQGEGSGRTAWLCSDRVEGQRGAEPVSDPSPPPVDLQYMHAAATEWIDAGPVVWGTPTVLPVAPEETDMPHATWSLWRFRLVSDDPAATTLVFNATVTAVRGGDVPRWPGHPDFYANGHTRLVFDGTARTSEAGTEAELAGQRDSFDQQEANRLVSHGTRALHAWVNVTSMGTTSAAVPGSTWEWYLRYHNASGHWERAEPLTPPDDPEKPQGLRFAISVDDAGMDSPYAPESRWEFNLRAIRVHPLYYSYGDGYDVEYRMVVLATDVPLDEKEDA